MGQHVSDDRRRTIWTMIFAIGVAALLMGLTIRPPVVALGTLIVLSFRLPAVGFAILPSFLGHGRRAIDLGAIRDYPEGQFVIATFLSATACRKRA